MFLEAFSAIGSVSLIFGLGLLQLVGVFFTGLTFYYFIGNPQAGGRVIANISKVGLRVYVHIWMLAMAVLAMLGFSFIVKAIFGLFGEFAYELPRRASTNVAAENDLKMGLILLFVSLLVLAIHKGFLLFAEKGVAKSYTITTKVAYGVGLFLHSLVMFGALFAFVFSLASENTPGAALAFLIGALPFWSFYTYKSLMGFKSE